MKLTLLSLVALGSASAMAIPEPYYMRVGELTAVANLAAVKATVQAGLKSGQGTGMIEGVRYVSRDAQGVMTYRVETGNCTLSAMVRRVLPPGVVGPGKIEVTPESVLVCASND